MACFGESCNCEHVRDAARGSRVRARVYLSIKRTDLFKTQEDTVIAAPSRYLRRTSRRLTELCAYEQDVIKVGQVVHSWAVRRGGLAGAYCILERDNWIRHLLMCTKRFEFTYRNVAVLPAVRLF